LPAYSSSKEEDADDEIPEVAIGSAGAADVDALEQDIADVLSGGGGETSSAEGLGSPDDGGKKRRKRKKRSSKEDQKNKKKGVIEIIES
jgi:hypothetical protein